MNETLLKQLNIAFTRVARGKDASAEFMSALVNCGAAYIEEVGTVVAYDPLRHNDTESGLLPDDPVRVLSRGIQYGDFVIVKADVVAN